MDSLYNFPAVAASDTVDNEGGGISRFFDAAQKGLTTAAMSGTLSIYNTFLDYGGQEAVDMERAIRDYDENYGSFYADNRDVVDVAGFVGTSLVPGTLGIKALKLAQAGNAVGPVSRALQFASSRKALAFDDAMRQLAASGGTGTSAVRGAKMRQLGWELADQTLTSAAFELGVLSTMNDSPIFEGDDVWDFAKNVATGALFGGAVGGIVEHLGVRGVLKNAQRTIEKERRLFDTVFDPVNLGLTKSDETMLFLENIVKLPDDFYSTNFEFKLGGKLQTRVLDTGEAFKTLKTAAEKTAFDTLALKFNELAEGGEITGQAMYKFILDTIKKGKEQGRVADDILSDVNGYIAGVKKISRLYETADSIIPPKQFFINNKPTGMMDLFSDVRGKNTGKQAYYLKTDDPTQIKFGSTARLGFQNAEEAFEAGYDAVFTTSGKIAINPKSKVISKTPDRALNNQFYLDLETGSLTSDVVKVAADMMKRPEDFKHFKDAIRVGGKEFKQAASQAADFARPTVEASARFMWASRLEDKAFKKLQIDASDFPMLDRMKLLPKNYLNGEGLTIKLKDGTVQSMMDVVDPVQFVNRLKLEWLADNLKKKQDVRHITNTLNVSREWFETAVAQNFASSRQLLQENRSLAEFFKPQTVLVEWDTKLKEAVALAGPTGPGHHATVIQGQHYRLMTHKNEQDNAFKAALGEDADLFMNSTDDLAKLTSEQGAGASTLGASNADYGRRAELFVQETGKQVALVSQRWKDAVINSLTSSVNAVRNNLEASAELGVLTTVLRRDSRKYYMWRDSVSDTAMLVDREAVKLYGDGAQFADIEEAVDAVRMGSAEKVRGIIPIKNKEVVQFLEDSMRANADRLEKQTPLLNAAGISRKYDPQAIYVPPVDTRRYPFFAFVTTKGRIGDGTDVSMITAKSEEQLRQLALQVGDEYEVVFKNDTKKFFKAKGIYDYSAQLNESTVNSALQKRGILGDYFPETRAENVLDDYVRWHANATDNLIRTAVQVKHRQFFSELAFLSEQFQSASTSATKSIIGLRKTIADPFDDYRKTALNLSKQSEYPILESLNEFVDKIGTKMYEGLDSAWTAFRGSKGKDLAPLQYANDLMESHGFSSPYKTVEAYLEANEKFPKNALKIGFQKVNLWLANTVLRFDFANSLVNIVSTPIMLGTELASIKRLAASNPELVGKLAELTSVKVPGQAGRVPSTTQLLGGAIKNYFGPEKLALIERYRQNGDIKDVSRLYHEVLDDLAYKPGLKVSDWSKKLDAAVEKGATLTGNNFSEEFTRFVSADVMRQLSDPLVAAKRMTVAEQNAYISSFVNRVQGNYIASQRPVLFQGTTGAAIGLFQTYAFNVLQQLFRHVENRNTRALLTFSGLQTGLYGMNGLPFFDAINQHLIGNASGNEGHMDAYSILPAANKEVGDWLLYGTASAFPLFGEKSPALYTRGDINPRHVSIIPINPLDIPAVSASIKLVDSMKTFAKQAGNGADISTAFLQALEHHGWNRPLAGFAQLLAGQSTTSKGSLISASNDLETTSMLSRIQERVVDFGGVSRVLGARPMDEAVALNNLYRNKAYDAADRARIDALGQVVKTKLYNNQMPSPEEMDEFMESYAKYGGRIETFSSALQRWSRDANRSVVNQLAAKVGDSSGRKLQMIMGGEELQDYSSLSGVETEE